MNELNLHVPAFDPANETAVAAVLALAAGCDAHHRNIGGGGLAVAFHAEGDALVVRLSPLTPGLIADARLDQIHAILEAANRPPARNSDAPQLRGSRR